MLYLTRQTRQSLERLWQGNFRLVDQAAESFANGFSVDNIDLPRQPGFFKSFSQSGDSRKWHGRGGFKQQVQIGPRFWLAARSAAEDMN